MDFGKILIGCLGYGFSIIVTLGALAAFIDVGRARAGRTDVGTVEENSSLTVRGIIAAFLVAIVTRLTLGAI